MSENASVQRRYFTTYSGVKLPFKLVNELAPAAVENRNTYFVGFFDVEAHMIGFDKLVYGEIELAHRYLYYPGSALRQAVITDIDGEVSTLFYAEDGSPISV
jgi:hypothetical protein